MRVATYSQPVAPSRNSLMALGILVLTILLGTRTLLSLTLHFVPQLQSLVPVLWLMTYILATAALMFVHGINWISWIVRYRILLVLLLLGTAASVSWAVDTLVSAEQVVHLLGASLVAIYLGFMMPLLTMLRVFAVVLGILLLMSIAAAVGMPALGLDDYEGTTVWKGVFSAKNAFGFWAAVGVLVYLTLSDSTRSFAWRALCYLMALVSLVCLYFSESATSLLALLVAGSVSLYMYIAVRFHLGFVRMVVLAVLFVGVLGFAISYIDTAALLGRSDDLTGRGEVWAQTWKLIMQRPLSGYGYGSLWFPNDATLWIQQSLTDFTWVVYHAHNGFLQIASEIGLPLSVLALLMVAQQLIEIFYCQYERQQTGVLFVLAYVLAYLISNFSEARFLVNRELFWIFFIALPISMLRQITLVAGPHEAEASDDGYAVQVPPGKPWLAPAGAIGAGTGSEHATPGSRRAAMPGQTTRLSHQALHELDELDGLEADGTPSGRALHRRADIDLGDAPEHSRDGSADQGARRTMDDFDEFDAIDDLGEDRFDKTLGDDDDAGEGEPRARG